ncbi:uncharacterized protein LOC130993335 [Salvia miltiorrhiza]|uniref:uncharacterized protein LOC130993335 n=1 Tax=Salvia miltiorrhiza TaxID=226208 RepID=UPI0025AD4F32|nr:uncharacterized protein LOC130993335 [Salvia miltiorrhiza]
MDSVLDTKTSLNTDFLGWMKSTATGSNISHHPHPPFSLGDAHDDGTTPAGGGVAAGFPFTGAQWQELERQAMIYKCMISCVPVPPHLLFPLDSSFPCGRYSRKGDPEPGRCKRTDGKKWRCSREVAPQQKYCERHLHRGRPRSRKPVEPNKKTRVEHTKTPPKTDYKETNSSKQPWMGPLQEDLNLLSYSYPEMDVAGGFIDERDVSLDLSMAMAVGKQIDDDFDAAKWLSPVSWERGGPLAEALSPATTVSSPSGVLHRTLFSHSDGSVCNSPTATFWL